MADLIRVIRLTFDGRHGLLPAEKETGVVFEVDLELEADLSAARASDRLADTVDYRDVASTVLEIGTGRSFHLVEKLASEIADAVLERHPKVDAITLDVRKLVPVVAGHPSSVGVRVTRRRAR